MGIGDISNELHTRSINGEVPSDQVRHFRGRVRIGGGRDPKRAWLAGHQAQLAHDLAHQLGRALGVLVDKIGMDAPIPVRAVETLNQRHIFTAEFIRDGSDFFGVDVFVLAHYRCSRAK
jgi:hypothetical protein